jgi:hypothetical protein
MRERLALAWQSRVLSPQQKLQEAFLAQALPQTCQNIFPAKSQLQHLRKFWPQSYGAPATAGFFRRRLLKQVPLRARRNLFLGRQSSGVEPKPIVHFCTFAAERNLAILFMLHKQNEE